MLQHRDAVRRTTSEGAQKLLAARVGQLEKKVLRRLEHRHAARHGRARILEFGRRVGGTAGFTVVAVLIVSAAFGAGALDKAIGQEHALLVIVVLLDLASFDEARVAQRPVDGFGAFAILVAVRGVVQIEVDVKTGEVA